MPVEIDRRIAEEIARRAARRLEILSEERPELLADRLSGWDPQTLMGLLDLTRLPGPLSDREPLLRHVGVLGVDHCTRKLISGDPGSRDAAAAIRYVEADLSELEDDDLLAACRYVPETLPGNLLG